MTRWWNSSSNATAGRASTNRTENGGGAVSCFHTVLIDHRAFGNAAVAAHAMLLAQQKTTDAKMREDVRGRGAPKLN